MDKKRIKVIFLDIDGVLNGNNIVIKTMDEIARKSKLVKFFWKRFDFFGTRTIKVFILSIITHLSGAKIVLSTSRRNNYFSDEISPNNIELKRKLEAFRIDVIDKTPDSIEKIRGEEIEEWLLSTNYEIESFVILDDEWHDIIGYFPDRVMPMTEISKEEILEGKLGDARCGLRFKDIKKALKILNTPNDFSYTKGFR